MMGRLGFYDTWRRWIRGCVFSGTISLVFINGSSTEEIEYSKGLRQGDPLAPFLFLVAVEGLSGLMRQAVALGLFFSGFRTGHDVNIALLQYADDTILVGDTCWESVWGLKAVLRTGSGSLHSKVLFFSAQGCE